MGLEDLESEAMLLRIFERIDAMTPEEHVAWIKEHTFSYPTDFGNITCVKHEFLK